MVTLQSKGSLFFEGIALFSFYFYANKGSECRLISVGDPVLGLWYPLFLSGVFLVVADIWWGY